MRRGLGLIWLGVTTVVAIVVGTIAYQAGWAAGLATRLPAGEAAPYYAFAPHPFFFGFFPFFGLLPFLFVLAILFFVFRGPRRWGPGGWGYGRYAGGPPPPQEAQQAPEAPRGAEDPLHDWPQRPADEQPQSGRR